MAANAYNRNRMITRISYHGFTECLEISNGDARVIVSTEFGPRILFYALDGEENILGWHGEAKVETDLGIWKPYGGHRLWIAPENMPLSYAPDNDPVEVEELGELSVQLVQPVDTNRATQKEMTIVLDPAGSGVSVEHRIENLGESEIEISAWALTIMAPGGEAIVPNEPFGGYSPDNLLPVRTMALWPYTDLTDPRWKFEKEAIRLRVDESIHSQQKFGVLNKQGWVGYEWRDLMFTKRFDFVEGAVYPDMNSNVEIYTDGGFVEVETLSPLQTILPGDSVEYTETWELTRNN